MMNRRGFLSALATGIVGTCVAVKVPTGWLPGPVQRLAACEYLRQHYNAWTKGKREGPGAMIVGRELYDAYEEELVANAMILWTQAAGPARHPCLLFKATPLLREGRGWSVRLVTAAEFARLDYATNRGPA